MTGSSLAAAGLPLQWFKRVDKAKAAAAAAPCIQWTPLQQLLQSQPDLATWSDIQTRANRGLYRRNGYVGRDA